MPKEKNELLRAELKKSSSDSKDIQANLLKRIKILENDFKRSQAQSIDFELKLQYQNEKIACDVSWKSKLSTINDENVLLETQVDYVVKVRENIKLEYKKLFKSIKVTRTQHKKELDELIKHVNQKTYAYADVHAQNQVLFITISELKNKLQTVDMEKTVNANFDKSETSRTLLCVTPLPKHVWLRLRKCQILRNSSVKRALFTTPIAGKSKNLGATSIVSKSRLSVAKTTIATNKFASFTPKLLRNSCEQGKSKKASFTLKLVPSTKAKLKLLHMDLCGPMRVTSINGKKYVLVIVDNYSRYTKVYFLRTKDEAPDMIFDFINKV
nr:ribonuclease H-like domain-containing protein [Tanacetum cinerariifolium]